MRVKLLSRQPEHIEDGQTPRSRTLPGGWTVQITQQLKYTCSPRVRKPVENGLCLPAGMYKKDPNTGDQRLLHQSSLISGERLAGKVDSNKITVKLTHPGGIQRHARGCNAFH